MAHLLQRPPSEALLELAATRSAPMNFWSMEEREKKKGDYLVKYNAASFTSVNEAEFIEI